MHLDNIHKTVARNTDPALMRSINAYWEDFNAFTPLL